MTLKKVMIINSILYFFFFFTKKFEISLYAAGPFLSTAAVCLYFISSLYQNINFSPISDNVENLIKRRVCDQFVEWKYK